MSFSHKKNKLLIHATSWVNLNIIILNSKSQTQMFVWFHLQEISRKSKYLKTESKSAVA